MNPDVSTFDQLFFVAQAWGKPIIRPIWPKIALTCRLESDKRLFDWCWFEANGDIPCSRELSSDLAIMRSLRRGWFIWDYDHKAPRYSGIGGSGDWVYTIASEGKVRAQKSKERLYKQLGAPLMDQMVGLIEALKRIEEESFDALEWIGRFYFALYVFNEQKRQYINAILEEKRIKQVRSIIIEHLDSKIAPAMHNAIKEGVL